MEMLKYTFAPTLHWGRFVALISLFDVLVFIFCMIASLVISGTLSSSHFLGPTMDVVYYFDKNPYEIVHDYQIWRLFTPIFLHSGFQHIVSNLAMQLIFGSLLESMVGFNHTMYLYFISG